MRLLCIALVVATGLFASSNGARIDQNIQVSTPTMPGVASRRPTLTTDQSAVVGKPFLRVADTLNSGGIESTGSSFKASAYPAPSGDDQEERTTKLPSSIAKLFKGKKATTAVMDLFTSNKNKMNPAKLRVKMLGNLPPELAAELIFLKPPKRLLPTNVPAKLSSKLPSEIKAQVFKIPGVADVTIRLQMEVWFYYRLPPTFVFRKLGACRQRIGRKYCTHSRTTSISSRTLTSGTNHKSI
ncbi:hypothetical protein ON010_g13769 [Phytophthora cinnamomi]|nr:hypothetical protein ON010_g13769 [Phytophthora cinnamomi]